jgi:hypothetical protein
MRFGLYAVTLLVLVGLAIPAVGSMEGDFKAPPLSARPWVYWFWLNGNITREGITADLEAMARVGIGGVLIMEVDQGAPLGPISFMSAVTALRIWSGTGSWGLRSISCWTAPYAV